MYAGGWIGYIHDVILYNLQINTRYYYSVGDSVSGWR